MGDFENSGMHDFYIPLCPGGLYHVLNHANGDERLFREEQNYACFLLKYRLHISPVAQPLAWCLLPNHYHFLVRIKQPDCIKAVFALMKKKPPENNDSFSDFIMQQFSNWQNSYAKAVNKVYARKGSLFMDYIRRVRIESPEPMAGTVFYVHKNPVHHGFAKTISDWPKTSYKEYVTRKVDLVDSDEVMAWFETIENFILFHQQPIGRK